MPYKDKEKQREANRRCMQRYYERHPERQISATAHRRKELKKWFREYKSTLSCIKCGESHPSCLDFHHRDPSLKDLNMQQVILYGWSRKRILEEIERCDVLCANCHRKHHYEERLRGREEVIPLGS